MHGIYVGLKPSGSGKRTHAVLFPGQKIYWRQLPEMGLEGFDVQHSYEQEPFNWGVYDIRGDAFQVTWQDGRQSVGRLGSDGSLELLGTRFFPVSKCNGLRLSGTYRRSASAPGGPSITFDPTGRFQDEGILDLLYLTSLLQYQMSHGWDPAIVQGGAGTYRIGNNTLELHYEDGRTIRTAIYLEPEEEGKERPNSIVLNTYDWVLQ